MSFMDDPLLYAVFSAALVEGTIFCMHGGLSPDLHSMQQVPLTDWLAVLCCLACTVFIVLILFKMYG